MDKISDRPTRSRNLEDKPMAKDHLEKYSKAFALCTMTIEYLESIYTGTPFCGWTDNKAYYFGSLGIGMLSVRPRSKDREYALVRIKEEHENIPLEFKDFKVTHGPRKKGEERSEGVAFEIHKPKDLKVLNNYLRKLNYIRFNKPKAGAWKEVKSLVDETTDTITKHYRKAVEEGFAIQREANLKRTFKSWLEANGIKNILLEENVHKDHSDNQRKSFADVIFESHKRKVKILTELKITKDTRSDIERSLGQLLRYRLYGEGYFCDELWTVSGHRPTLIDIAWVDDISNLMKLTYRLAWLEEDGTFKVHPKPPAI